MIGWYNYLRKEARAFAILAPLLAVSALAGAEATKSLAASGLSESPVSPISPLPTATPTGVVALGLNNYLWLIGLVVLLVILVTGVVLWQRRRTS